MSTAESAAIVRRYVVDLNHGRLHADDPRRSELADVCTPDYVIRGPNGQGVTGLDAVQALIPGMLRALGDLQFTLEDMVAQDDTVIARVAISGTHVGEFRGLAPTGRAFVFRGNNLFRVRDGKVAEEWIAEDFLGLLEQLGAVPVPRSKGSA